MSKGISHSGSITTSAAEQTIGAVYADGKMRQLWLSAANMVAGDQVRLRVYVTINGVSLVYREWMLSDAYTSEPAIPVHAVSNFSSLSFTILRVAGTDRAFGYQIEPLE